MPDATIVYAPQLTSVGAIELSASIRETHVYPNEVTAEPVDEGGDVTDHVRVKPVEVTIEGLVSNVGFADQSSSSAEAFEALLELRNSRQTTTLITGLASYADMAVVNLSFPRGANTGDALPFTLVLKQIRKVKTSTTTLAANTRTPKARGKSRRGQQIPKEFVSAVRSAAATARKMFGL